MMFVKKALLVAMAMCVSTSVMADKNPTLFGFLTLGKTTMEEFESKVVKSCKWEKEYNKEYNSHSYLIEQDCFNLPGHPRIYIEEHDKKIALVVLAFLPFDSEVLRYYWKKIDQEYGKKVIFDRGLYKDKNGKYSFYEKHLGLRWIVGETAILLESNPEGFDISYNHLGTKRTFTQNVIQ